MRERFDCASRRGATASRLYISILHMSGHMSRLTALKQEERAVGRQSRSHILIISCIPSYSRALQSTHAQHIQPGFSGKSSRSKSLGKLQPMITLGRLGKGGKFARRPVKLAARDDHTANGRAVPADPFRGGLDDNVGAVLDGADNVASLVVSTSMYA